MASSHELKEKDSARLKPMASVSMMVTQSRSIQQNLTHAIDCRDQEREKANGSLESSNATQEKEKKGCGIQHKTH